MFKLFTTLTSVSQFQALSLWHKIPNIPVACEMLRLRWQHLRAFTCNSHWNTSVLQLPSSIYNSGTKTVQLNYLYNRTIYHCWPNVQLYSTHTSVSQFQNLNWMTSTTGQYIIFHQMFKCTLHSLVHHSSKTLTKLPLQLDRMQLFTKRATVCYPHFCITVPKA